MAHEPSTQPFQKHQHAFTQWIRHPNEDSLPNGISAKRMNTYRDLIFNNISSFVEHTYPVTQTQLPSDLWDELIEVFFKYGQCDSPYYYDISLHFKDFLDQDFQGNEDLTANSFLRNIHSEYPWLRELMQFEWMQLYVEMSEVEWQNDHTDLQLKTTCWILAYQYPVQTWSIDTTVDDIQVQPTCLMVYRDENFLTQVYPIHPVWAFIIETLQAQPDISLTTLNAELQQTTQLAAIDVQNILNQVFAWLQTLNLLTSHSDA